MTAPGDVLELVIAFLQGLPEQDRQALAELINQCAQEENDRERQLTAWETPETLGSWRESGHPHWNAFACRPDLL